jgi:hypothetical protein
MSRAWQEKVLCTEICMELTFHSPPPTPLLPAPTLSAGEYKVSGGELKVSGRVGSASQSTRSSLEAQNGLPLFLAAFSRLLLCRHGGATGFLLKSPRPLPLPARLLSYLGLPAACLARCVSLTTVSLLRLFLRSTTSTMVRKKITRDELSARAKANGYRRGAHRDKRAVSGERVRVRVRVAASSGASSG